METNIFLHCSIIFCIAIKILITFFLVKYFKELKIKLNPIKKRFLLYEWNCRIYAKSYLLTKKFKFKIFLIALFYWLELMSSFSIILIIIIFFRKYEFYYLSIVFACVLWLFEFLIIAIILAKSLDFKLTWSQLFEKPDDYYKWEDHYNQLDRLNVDKLFKEIETEKK